MSHNIDYSFASSEQIEAAICKRLETIRLSRNLTQAQLAKEAGVSVRTIGRLEKGAGISFDTLIRVMTVLGVQQNLEALLPDPGVRPIERINLKGKERRRARPDKNTSGSVVWSWGNSGDDNE